MMNIEDNDVAENTEQQFYRDVRRLLREVNKTLKAIKFEHPNYSGLCDAAANVEEYFEVFETPQSMGWVGQDGLP